MHPFISKHRTHFLTISVGIVYIWFGALKFFSGVSPAESLATDTITKLTFGLVAPGTSIILLALIETAIGFMLITHLWQRAVVAIALWHMACTFSVFLFFPSLVFGPDPFSLTLVGQYVVKNLVIVAALIAMYPEKK